MGLSAPGDRQPTRAHVQSVHAGVIVADTRSSARTLETSHPPSYYIPPSDISPRMLRRAGGGSFCEWKGEATYWDVVIGEQVLPRAGWSYPRPTAPFECLRDHIAFYAGPFDRCSIDGETVVPQAGGFYGGWITSRQAGPFKGGPGTMGW